MQRRRTSAQSEDAAQVADLKERLTKLFSRWEVQSCKAGSKDAACHVQAAKTISAAAELIHTKQRLVRSRGNIRQQLQQDLPAAVVLTLLGSSSPNAQQLTLSALVKVAGIQPDVVPVEAVSTLVHTLTTANLSSVKHAAILLSCTLLHARASVFIDLWKAANGSMKICQAVEAGKSDPAVVSAVVNVAAKLATVSTQGCLALLTDKKEVFASRWVLLLTELLQSGSLPNEGVLSSLSLLQSFLQERLFLQHLLGSFQQVKQLLQAVWAVFARHQSTSLAVQQPHLSICSAALSAASHPALYLCLQQQLLETEASSTSTARDNRTGATPAHNTCTAQSTKPHSSKHSLQNARSKHSTHNNAGVHNAHPVDGEQGGQSIREWLTGMLQSCLSFSQVLRDPNEQSSQTGKGKQVSEGANVKMTSSSGSSQSTGSSIPIPSGGVTGLYAQSAERRSALHSRLMSSYEASTSTPTSASASASSTSAHAHAASIRILSFHSHLPTLSPSLSASTSAPSSSISHSLSIPASPPPSHLHSTRDSLPNTPGAFSHSAASTQQVMAAQALVAKAICCLLLPPVHTFGLKPPASGALVKVTDPSQLIAIIKCLTDGIKSSAGSLELTCAMPALRWATHLVLQANHVRVAAQLYCQVYEMFLQQVHNRVVGSWYYLDGLLDVLLLTQLLEMKCYCQLHAVSHDTDADPTTAILEQISLAERLFNKCDVVLSTRAQYVAAVRDVLLRVALPWSTNTPKSFPSSRIPQPSSSSRPAAAHAVHAVPPVMPGHRGGVAHPQTSSSSSSPPPSSHASTSAAHHNVNTSTSSSSPAPSSIPKYSVSLGMSLFSSGSVAPDQQELGHFLGTCAQLVVKMVKGMGTHEGMNTMLPLLRSLLTVLWVLHPMLSMEAAHTAGPAGIAHIPSGAYSRHDERRSVLSATRSMGWLQTMAMSLDAITVHSLQHLNNLLWSSAGVPGLPGRCVVDAALMNDVARSSFACFFGCNSTQPVMWGPRATAQQPPAMLCKQEGLPGSSLSSSALTLCTSHCHTPNSTRTTTSTSQQLSRMDGAHGGLVEEGDIGINARLPYLYPGPVVHPTWLMFQEVQCAAAVVVGQYTGRLGNPVPWLDCSPLRNTTHLSDLYLATHDGREPVAVHAAVLAARCPKLLEGAAPRMQQSVPNGTFCDVPGQHTALQARSVTARSAAESSSSSTQDPGKSESAPRLGTNSPRSASSAADSSTSRTQERSKSELALSHPGSGPAQPKTIRLSKRISPAMLDAILKYIYSGAVHLDTTSHSSSLSLTTASDLQTTDFIKLCAALKLSTLSALLKAQPPMPGSHLGNDFFPAAVPLCPRTMLVQHAHPSVLDLPPHVTRLLTTEPVAKQLNQLLQHQKIGRKEEDADGIFVQETDGNGTCVKKTSSSLPVGDDRGVRVAGASHEGQPTSSNAHAVTVPAGTDRQLENIADACVSHDWCSQSQTDMHTGHGLCTLSAYAHLLAPHYHDVNIDHVFADVSAASSSCDVLLAGPMVSWKPCSVRHLNQQHSANNQHASSQIRSVSCAIASVEAAVGHNTEIQQEHTGFVPAVRSSTTNIPLQPADFLRKEEISVANPPHAASVMDRPVACHEPTSASSTADWDNHTVMRTSGGDMLEALPAGASLLPHAAIATARAAHGVTDCLHTVTAFIPVHKVLLAAKCEYFQVMFSERWDGAGPSSRYRESSPWLDSEAGSGESRHGVHTGRMYGGVLRSGTSGEPRVADAPAAISNTAGSTAHGAVISRASSTANNTESGASNCCAGSSTVKLLPVAHVPGADADVLTVLVSFLYTGQLCFQWPVALPASTPLSTDSSTLNHPPKPNNTGDAVCQEVGDLPAAAPAAGKGQEEREGERVGEREGERGLRARGESVPVRCSQCHDVQVCCRLMACCPALLLPELPPLCLQHIDTRLQALPGECLLSLLTSAASLELREVLDAAVDACVRRVGVPSLQSSPVWSALDVQLQQLLTAEHLHHLKHGDKGQDVSSAPPASGSLMQLADELQQLADNPFLLPEDSHTS